jgi:hypothetical protein
MQILQLCYAKHRKGFTVITETILSAVEIQNKIVYAWYPCVTMHEVSNQKSQNVML